METQSAGASPQKVVHIIADLNTGGAEMMLLKLLRYSDKDWYRPAVISLTDIGPVGKKIRELGVLVYELGLHRGIAGVGGFVRLLWLLRRLRPDLVQTWMYHADLVGGLASKLSLSGALVVWGIRQSNLHDEHSKQRTKLIARVSALFSRWLPEKILCVSESARATHEAMGYDKAKMIVIPNGFDLARFKPDPAARLALREELGIGQDTPLIGYIARFDPQKDHHTFLKAVRLMPESVHVVLCGRNVDWGNSQLASWIEEFGLKERAHLLGERDDIPRVTAALDIATLAASYGEGFPNVLGEAMACGVPCVATNVGDASAIIAQTGRIVPIGNPSALAGAWQEMLALPEPERKRLGEQARERVLANYDIRDVVLQYVRLYENLWNHKEQSA